MAYLGSQDVKVYPSTRRSAQVDARPLTEFQLVSIVNRLIDLDGFVITTNFNPSQTGTQSLEFNIHGYYFKIPDVQQLLNLFTTSTNIYAHIFLDNISSPSYVELYGQDDNQVYKGITFTTDDTRPTEDPSVANYDWYKLNILNRGTTSEDWKIPAASKVRFSENVMPAIPAEKIGITEIDGGLIE